MRRSAPVTALLAAIVTLQGCSGSVAVRSSFGGPPVPPVPPSAAASPHPGLHANGGAAFAAALVLGVIIVDAVDWAAQRLGQGSDDSRHRVARPPLFQPIDRGWVDRGP